ncbi:LuxR C-terminal-related transcriptional regulator [Amycolatopsis nivea]|uniref:LuxR C-terminal-related transcriptional regulator n=1 Tax=Amycolatopsis nivea TaxID=1644109 RepID=UPI00196B7216|nr:LuxR C-terminal-related transcriptional regulator [Amycolatopsis nivea]
MTGPARPGVASPALVAVVDSLAAAASVAELQDCYMRAVPQLLSSRSFAIYVRDPRNRAPVSRATEGASDVFLSRYEELGRERDPVLRHCLTANQAAHSSRLMSQDRWTEHPVYREVMSLHGWRMVLETPIVAGAEIVGTLNFADRDAGALSSDEDLAVATALGRVVGLVLSGLLRQETLLRERDHLETAVDVCDNALVLTDHRGGQRRFNAAARAALRRVAPDGPTEWLENVMAANPDASTQVAESGGVRATLRTVRVPSQPALSVTTLDIQDGPGGEIALSPSLSALLSPREREVARLAVSGLHDDQIAAKIFLSRYTVKQHLKSVYRKLGVDSRTALARLVLHGT